MPAKKTRKLPGGVSKATLRKIATKAAELRAKGIKPGPALKRAWALQRQGKL